MASNRDHGGKKITWACTVSIRRLARGRNLCSKASTISLAAFVARILSSLFSSSPHWVSKSTRAHFVESVEQQSLRTEYQHRHTNKFYVQLQMASLKHWGRQFLADANLQHQWISANDTCALPNRANLAHYSMMSSVDFHGPCAPTSPFFRNFRTPCRTPLNHDTVFDDGCWCRSQYPSPFSLRVLWTF